MSRKDPLVRVKSHLVEELRPIIKAQFKLEFGDSEPNNTDIVNKALIGYIESWEKASKYDALLTLLSLEAPEVYKQFIQERQAIPVEA